MLSRKGEERRARERVSKCARRRKEILKSVRKGYQEREQEGEWRDNNLEETQHWSNLRKGEQERRKNKKWRREEEKRRRILKGECIDRGKEGRGERGRMKEGKAIERRYEGEKGGKERG